MTHIKKDRLFHGGAGVVENLEDDFTAAVAKYIGKHKDWAVTGEFFSAAGDEECEQYSEDSYIYVPKWRIAIFFFHKKPREATLGR